MIFTSLFWIHTMIKAELAIFLGKHKIKTEEELHKHYSAPPSRTDVSQGYIVAWSS